MTNRIESFQSWNSTENAAKYMKGEQVEDFKMFDYEKGNSDDYFSKLKDFAQEYIDKFDNDKDGSWNKDEFIAMGLDNVSFDKDYVESLGYKYTPENAQILEDNQKVILSLLYDGFLMNDKDGIQSDEFASQLLVADYYDDPEGKTDGKINFARYNSYATNIIVYDDNGDPSISKDYVHEVSSRKALWEQVF